MIGDGTVTWAEAIAPRINYPSPFQVVILAGGKGTRIMEETATIPKPLLKVGDKTLLEHIIDIYSIQGLHEFLIPVGYKRQLVFNYFRDRFEITYIDTELCATGLIGKDVISIIDTGEDTQTGGRIKRLQPRINAPFYLTYGDGLGNVNLHKLLEQHERNDSLVTLTAVHPMPRFGSIKFYSPFNDKIYEFGEKRDNLGLVNGGFMICEPNIFSMIDGDDVNFEAEVLPYLTSISMLSGYKHDGFWYCVDTLRDLEYMRNMERYEGAKWLEITG